MRRALVVLGAAALLLAGCSSDGTPETAAPAASEALSAPAPPSIESTLAPADSPPEAAGQSNTVLDEVLDWLSGQPNWIWLLVAAMVTHRLTLRREKWNREQARRTEQRKAIADFSAAVNGAAPQAAELATWLQRLRTARNATDRNLASTKVDEAMGKFADKIFEMYRASDLLKMSLVDPELSYRATFALKLAQDLAELGGDRRRDPGAQQMSLDLLEMRCTERLKQLMGATDLLLNAAVARIPPQTTWFQRRLAGAHYRSKADEIEQFVREVERETAAIHKGSASDMGRKTEPAGSTAG